MSDTKSFRNELYYIVHLDNIPSIIQHGILCHEDAEKYDHVTVALEQVQERRENKSVPQGLPLHKYVNLYFNPRNPMMFKRQNQFNDLCVLGVDASVITTPGVVISDMNASKDLCKFMTWEDAIVSLDFEEIYAKYWNHPEDEVLSKLHKGIMCAEVLVPASVSYTHVIKAFTANRSVETKLKTLGFDKQILIKPDMFFK
jgi:hypothetical protein